MPPRSRRASYDQEGSTERLIVTSTSVDLPVPARQNSASRPTGIALLVFAILGLWPSFQLLQSELTILRAPGSALSCDMNPLIACSTSLLSNQSRLLFGIPNSIIGIIAFSALAALAVVLVSKYLLPAWIWWAMGAASVVGVAYVIYFLHASITVFQALCPYCMVIWVAALGFFVVVWSHILATGLAGEKAIHLGTSLQRYWWLILIALLLIIAVLIFFGLSGQIRAAFFRG